MREQVLRSENEVGRGDIGQQLAADGKGARTDESTSRATA
eukprot:CAMPEP_0177379722 /NCGR_PEP_ID=MMETSP0368-20130122/47095_1 /TAXON_ID=447022 ORGANISM="Scrippsiella hangoei-like, Strain SHHI-4" /NCGR_SAMPLE_ID=MMETSP0368 /ASSEMBLY_ACC=CAM_ASM_000363 /LENGTH=39 /DNA_ID= /DNA_START= /DNA_END= /DNA_ORIENTATION=